MPTILKKSIWRIILVAAAGLWVQNALAETICRILSLKSNTPVTRVADPTGPARTLFGTGAFDADDTNTNPNFEIKIQNGAGTGMFTGNGLIYNDGKFGTEVGTPPPVDCTGPWEQCYADDPLGSRQIPFPYETPRIGTSDPPPNDFDLSLDQNTFARLSLLSNDGGRIIFLDLTRYQYVGGKFANHTGVVKERTCIPVPAPGTIALMLVSFTGLAVARKRQKARGPRKSQG